MRWTSWARTIAFRRRAGKSPDVHSSGSAYRASLSLAAAFSLFFFSIALGQQTQTQQAATPRPSTALPAPRSANPRFVVLLDPAHGGTDDGALLGTAGVEKDYVLGLAVQLRALLNRHGVHTIMTRDGDSTLGPAARAEIANRAQATACILLHASQTGNGVHLFTSSMPVSAQPDPRRTFLPWQTAQGAYGTQSLRLESDFDAAFVQQHIPVLLDKTSMILLDSMACPAVAVEIAPLDAGTPLTDPRYRRKVIDSLDAALIAWQNDWRLRP